MIEPELLERASQAMHRLGLTPNAESDKYYPQQYRHHLAFQGPLGLVELHFHPVSAHGIVWSSRGPLSRAQTLTVEGRPARWLSLEDEVVFLAVHAANHLLQRLGWLYDIRLLLEKKPQLDWNKVELLAREDARLPALLYYALSTAESVVDAPVPESVLYRLRPSLSRRWLATRLFSKRWCHGGGERFPATLQRAARFWLADSRFRAGQFALARASRSLMFVWSRKDKLTGQ